jgi:hypothetical protein
MADDTPMVGEGDQADDLGTEDRRTNVGWGNLRPFTKGDPRASELGRRGVEVRRAKQAVQRASSQEAGRHLAELIASHDRDTLGDAAAAAALDAIARVSRGEIVLRGQDVADWVRVLVDVARLEAGQATSQAVVAHLGADAAARVRELREQARTALGQGGALDCGGVES